MSLEFMRTCGVGRLIAEGNWLGCRGVHSFALQGVHMAFAGVLEKTMV